MSGLTGRMEARSSQPSRRASLEAPDCRGSGGGVFRRACLNGTNPTFFVATIGIAGIPEPIP